MSPCLVLLLFQALLRSAGAKGHPPPPPPRERGWCHQFLRGKVIKAKRVSVAIPFVNSGQMLISNTPDARRGCSSLDPKIRARFHVKHRQMCAGPSARRNTEGWFLCAICRRRGLELSQPDIARSIWPQQGFSVRHVAFRSLGCLLNTQVI